jgi:hypothetical protein
MTGGSAVQVKLSENLDKCGSIATGYVVEFYKTEAV